MQEKDIDNQPVLLLEQAFESYSGFILGRDEICHILNSKKQIEAIRDLEYCRGMFNFKNNEYIYIRKLKLKTKILLNNILYWACSIYTFLTAMYALSTKNLPMLFFTVIFGFGIYISARENRTLLAARRIDEKYYGPQV